VVEDFNINRSPTQFYADQIEYKKRVDERIDLKKDQIRLEEEKQLN
jgi:hypothetical protein